MSLERTNVRNDSPVVKILVPDAKVGATSGWTVRAGADSFMATCAASQSAATLVVPIPGLVEGDRIEGYHIVGQIESGGNAVTVDCAIYESLAVAAASTHTVQPGTSMTQLSVTADTAMTESNTKKVFADTQRVVVKAGAAYFALITATTNGSTDIEFLALVVHVRKNR